MTFLKLLAEAFRDLFWPILPSGLFRKNESEPAFAFLVHPRDIADVYKKYPHSEALPIFVLKWMLRHFWPVIVSEVEGLHSKKTGKPIRGWIITTPLTADEMMRDRPRAVGLIRRGIKLAHYRGANFIGLGALNASVTYRGRELKDLLDKFRFGVTTGVGYTAYNISDLAMTLLSRFKLDARTTHFGIVGAAGSIATSTIRHLLKKGLRNFTLVDVERKKDRMINLIDEYKKQFPDANFKITSNLWELKNCRFIVSATNTPEALIRKEHLSPGTVIIDDAQPSDIDSDVIINCTDVLVIEGGVIEVKGINPHVSFGLKHKTDVFSCLAEVMVLAAYHRNQEQNFDYLYSEEIEEIGNLGKELGFGRAEFQNFNKVYSDYDIEDFYKKYILG